MAKYRKRPVVIEATQWFENGDHPQDDWTWARDRHGELLPTRGEGHVVRYYRRPDDPGERQCEHCALTMHDHGWIDTLEGGHNVCPGDWIITGVQGERYPIKDEIFRETYDALEDAPRT